MFLLYYNSLHPKGQNNQLLCNHNVGCHLLWVSYLVWMRMRYTVALWNLDDM
jgi:hypothetical protein